MGRLLEKIESIFGSDLRVLSVDGDGVKAEVSCECPAHGKFVKRMDYLLKGVGCPDCEAAFRSSIAGLPRFEQFLAKSRKIHKDKYDYSKVEYKDSHQAVTIICPTHGEFSQKPMSHVQGVGCPQCGKTGSAKSRTRTVESFLAEASEVHSGKYDYSLVTSGRTTDKVEIVCPDHGVFTQRVGDHLKGSGCPKCKAVKTSKTQKWATEDFIREATAVHGDLYDYSLADYKSSTEKVKILCAKHGVFEQRPASHIRGEGCPKCAAESNADRTRLDVEELVAEFRKVHGDKYDYSQVEYISLKKDVKIICPEHGEFYQKPYHHKSGSGCDKCAKARLGDEFRKTTAFFVGKAAEVHSGKYVYSQTEYFGCSERVEIECPKHGPFLQLPYDHLDGHGCPSCAWATYGKSLVADEFTAWVQETFGGEIETEKLITEGRRFRMDVFLPELNLGIDFNGLNWHSTRTIQDRGHHFLRWKLAKGEGIDLVYIHEDEWKYRRSAVENMLTHLLGKSERVYARNTELKLVEPQEATDFYEQYHIQGYYGVPELSYGLFQGEQLVACMSFSRKTSNRKNPYGEGKWELIRFASVKSVVGGASKLFKHFLKQHNPQEVVSFSMNHLFNGTMYQKLGFSLDKVLPIDYTYVYANPDKRLHKSGFQKSRLAERFEKYDPSLTEEENCANHGFFRIYDCGKKRWIWRP